MGRTQIAARIDTPEYEAIQTIAEDRDLSQSEVIRRLIQDGLTHRREQKKSDEPDETTDESDDSDDNTRVVANQSVTPSGAAIILALAGGVSSFSVSANAFLTPGIVAFLGAMLGGFGALGAIVVTKHQLR
jgi:hypothetical protein